MQHVATSKASRAFHLQRASR